MREQIETDMALLRHVGRLLERVPKLKWLNPSGMLDEFASLLLMQLDLTAEARHLEKFRRNFPPESSTVSFPEPMRPFVSTGVLVETYIHLTSYIAYIIISIQYIKDMYMIGIIIL